MRSTESSTRARAAAGLALLVGLGLAPLAGADGPSKPGPSDPAWREECGSCHVPYPARLLPAESWRLIMAGLGDHFGSDASIDDAARASAIEAFLVTNARKPKNGAAPGAAPAPLRITETPWFRGEHDEVSASKWKSPAVASPANCGACHPRADQGSYSEDDVRIP